MAMNKNERLQIADLLRQGFTESRKSDAGNMAVFYDAHNMMVYAGIIQEWPLISLLILNGAKSKSRIRRRNRSQARRLNSFHRLSGETILQRNLHLFTR